MAVIQNNKINKVFDNLLSRQEYLVTQSNDLARSFGNLTAFQHKLFDFCFSFVQKDNTVDKIYKTDANTIIHHFGLTLSGSNYQRVIKGFKALNEKTAIYMSITLSDGSRGIMMTSLFDYISVGKSGMIEFQFGRKIAPYVFELKERFYSFKLSELSRVRSKYTLTLLKLWNANGYGTWKPETNQLPEAHIEGSLQEWKSWFLGNSEENENWIAGQFKRNILDRALNEL
ncbi:replication initiation protein, partial [Lactobacillus sp. AN1001]